MHIRYCKNLVLAALAVLMLGGTPYAQASSVNRPVLILADLSGSSQARLGYFSSPEENDLIWTTRAAALKKILTMFARNLPSDYCPVGLFEMRYLSGDKDCYIPIIPVDVYQSCNLTEMLNDRLVTEKPVFNRRTALADGLRQLDENILQPSEGRAIILLISDGMENIRSCEAEDAENTQEVKIDGPVSCPLTEARRLSSKYKDNLVIHVIGLEGGPPEERTEKEQQGLDLLQKMANATGGRYFSGGEMLQNQERFADIYSLLCGKRVKKDR